MERPIEGGNICWTIVSYILLVHSHHSLVKTERRRLTKSWNVNSVFHLTSHKKPGTFWKRWVVRSFLLHLASLAVVSLLKYLEINEFFKLSLPAAETKCLITTRGWTRRCCWGSGMTFTERRVSSVCMHCVNILIWDIIHYLRKWESILINLVLWKYSNHAPVLVFPRLIHSSDIWIGMTSLLAK